MSYDMMIAANDRTALYLILDGDTEIGVGTQNEIIALVEDSVLHSGITVELA